MTDRANLSKPVLWIFVCWGLIHIVKLRHAILAWKRHFVSKPALNTEHCPLSLQDDVNAELAKKQAEVEGLMQRVSELEKLLEDERRDFEAQARMYREQNASLRAEMDQRFKEFNELMSIKVALDQEILAYR